MSHALPTPSIAYPTLPTLPQDVAQLHQRLAEKTKAPQGELATTLIQSAASELIDTFFTQLLNELVAAHDSEPSYREARAMVREINDKLTHYLGWASSFFSNERIRPAVAHYHAMMHVLAEATDSPAYIVLPCPEALAQRIEAQIDRLQHGQAASAHEAIETLIAIIDIAMHELLITPKKLMKFNFVVDKTLSGVISLMQSMAYRSLRKLAEHLPSTHQPIVAAHLRRLVRLEKVAQAA